MPHYCVSFSCLQRSLRAGWPDENCLIRAISDFGLCFLQLPTICIQADQFALEDLCVVYDFMQNAEWDGWKRLAAEVVFLSKMEVTNLTSGAPTLTIDNNFRDRIYVVLGGEYDSNTCWVAP